ncbi:MAG: hypothetical protein LIO71_01660 [Ruminococcus sp.]|nr:hypothetical protein [Ruminococcus sp.]MCD7799866.1 hypothetical protein [Ruminococcus sp.]
MQFSVTTVLEFFGMTMGVLLVIYIALVSTPKVARRIDKFAKDYRQKHPKSQEDERLYLVKSPFDGNRELDMDKLYEQEKARRENINQEVINNDDNNTLNDNGDVNNNG